MKRIKQTRLGDKEGNCLEACLASLLELGIDNVPVCGDKENWFEILNNWLIFEFGLYMVVMKIRPQFVPKGYHMIWGEGPRYKDVDHSVVGLHGKIIFDPHPSNEGLVKKNEYVVLARLIR